MTPEEAAYVAGFFDGEGYVTIRRSNRTIRPNPVYRLVIGFTNTDLPILQWLRELLGGGNINPKSRRSVKHAPAFELTISNRGLAAQLLSALQPFVRIKQQQIALGLAFLALPKIRKIMIARGKAWPIFKAVASEVELREQYKQEMALVNMRGPKCLQ